MSLPKPYYQDGAVTLYHGDCREIVPLLGRFDLLLTDPPYGMDYSADNSNTGDAKKAAGKKWESKVFGDDEPFDPSPWLALSVPTILWGANHYATRLPARNSWIVWNKRGDGAPSGMHFSDCEIAWCSVGGGIRLFSNMWHGAPRWRTEGSLHPTQKPVSLMAWCIQNYAPNAQTVLDPFAGSGTTGRACKDLGRKCVMIEREERYCEIAARRMAQEVLPLEATA